jgi:hypothetical protein
MPKDPVRVCEVIQALAENDGVELMRWRELFSVRNHEHGTVVSPGIRLLDCSLGRIDSDIPPISPSLQISLEDALATSYVQNEGRRGKVMDQGSLYRIVCDFSAVVQKIPDSRGILFVPVV